MIRGFMWRDSDNETDIVVHGFVLERRPRCADLGGSWTPEMISKLRFYADRI